jgi:conjugal transfer mating pair stabilization protein TraN
VENNMFFKTQALCRMRFFVILACWLCSPLAMANTTADFNQAYQQGAQTGNGAAVGAENIVRNFSPERELPNYNPNPGETGHYTGTEQSFNNVSAEGARAAQQSESGKAIYKSFEERPLYRVDHQSQGMQRSTIISNNAANIAQGISNAFVDCKKTQECRTTYTEHTC